MRGELFISGRERNLSSVKRRRQIAHPGISLSPHDLYRARGSDRSMSCLVSESIIENRVRGEPGGRRRKKRKRARGGKRSGSLLETLVERCLTGTCCWWHTNEYLPLLSAACTLARPRCSSRPLSPSLASLRSFRGARYFIPPCVPLHLFARLPRVSFMYEEVRRTPEKAGEGGMTSS